MKTNVYQMVTDRIVEQLAKGVVPWQMPWSCNCLSNGGAINYVTRKPYSFLNQCLLGKTGEYLTFNQVKNLGGHIKKGAKSSIVVFYKMLNVADSKNTDVSEKDKEDKVKIPMLRYYNVFHLDDVEGIESKIKEKEEEEFQGIEPIEAAENVIKDYVGREDKLTFENDKPSSKAYYSPSLDKVVVPMLSQYSIAEEYYSTAFHELTHSTSPEYRCNRKSNKVSSLFGGKDYSREELVAEIGSAMLCNFCGINNEKAFQNSVAYIQGWLSKLGDDNKMIVWASSRAEKAARYILNIQED